MSEEKRGILLQNRSDVRPNQFAAKESDDYPLAVIEEAVRFIRYGAVQIVIQDGRIVQIEKTEKIRLR